MIRTPVASAIVASALAAGAVAAEPESRLDTLAPVVVVGIAPLPGAELKQNQIAAPVQTATAQQIDSSHALDLSAYLSREVGSVHVNDVQNNPLQMDVNFRGYTASPLLGTPQGLSVYLDGVRLNQPFGDVVSWDLIPRQAIATLALIPGSNPVFGLNTLGGALALRTKDGLTDPGLSVGLNYGSNERRSIEAEVGGHADSGVYWYGTANNLKEDGWRDASPTAATQVFGKLGYRDGISNTALTVAWADTDLTGNGLQDLQLLHNDYASVYTKPDNTRNKSYLLNLVTTGKLGDKVTLSANTFYRNIRTSTLNGDLNEESLGKTPDNAPYLPGRCIAGILTNSQPNETCNGLLNRNTIRQHDGGAGAQVTVVSSLWGRENRTTMGAALVHSGSRFGQSSQFGYLAPDRGIVTVDGPGAFADGSQDSVSAFDARVDLRGSTNSRSVYLSNTLQLLPIAALTLSGRYDHTSLASVDNLTPAGSPGSLAGDHRFARFNPAAGLTLSPNAAFTAYMGYSQGSRAPSVIELGCADPDNPCRLPNAMAGDPPLDQVKTRTWEVGLRGRATDAARWNLGVFRAENRDDIMFVADDQSGFGYFRNFGRTRRQGVEAGASAGIGPVTLGGNVTLLDATYRSAETVGGAGNSSNDAGPGFEGTIDIEPGDRIPLIPRHIAKLTLDWQISPVLSVNADAINVAGAWSRGNENNAHAPDGVYYIGPGRTGGYTVVNLGAELRPLPAMKIFLLVDNLLDRRYFTGSQLGSTGFNAAGNFVARPFAGPVVDGGRPLLGSTFMAPGAPRTWWLGVKYQFLAGGADQR